MGPGNAVTSSDNNVRGKGEISESGQVGSSHVSTKQARVGRGRDRKETKSIRRVTERRLRQFARRKVGREQEGVGARLGIL